MSLLTVAFWSLSITPLGSSLFLGSLGLINNRADVCVRKDVNSLILMPGGLSWRPTIDGGQLSDWSITRADRALEILRVKHNTQVILPGGLGRGQYSEAELLKKYIQSKLDISNVLIGKKSKNTFENLETLMPMISKDKPYFLVTSYWHMPRAKSVADKLSIITCPVVTKIEIDWSLIPSYEAHWHSKAALHEWIGLVWYKVKGKI